ncbi:hypothetical protein [Micromonospora sicca]|nr:hypothetical protein [Micromonospora sp. 4G53]
MGPALSGGPELVEMTPDDLVGVWQGDQRGGVIEFTADGDFYADDVGYMFVGFTDVLPAGFDIKHDKAPGSGQWSIGKLLGHSQAPSGLIDLHFDVLAKRPTAGGNSVEAQRSDGAIVLVHYIGDPDASNTVVYRKCQARCSHIAPKRKALGKRIDVTPGQLVGAWKDTKRGSTIVFDRDGGFRGDDFSYLFGGDRFALPVNFDRAHDRAPGVGTWKLERPQSDSAGPNSNVHLLFTNVAGQPRHIGSRPMQIFASGSSLVLVNYSSDPSVNEQRTYTKCAACTR